MRMILKGIYSAGCFENKYVNLYDVQENDYLLLCKSMKPENCSEHH